MHPSLEWEISQAIRKARHLSNGWDTPWADFLSQVVSLIARAIENIDEIPVAIDIVFSKVTGHSVPSGDGDHHSPTYGEEINLWHRDVGAAFQLAENTEELKRLIKERIPRRK